MKTIRYRHKYSWLKSKVVETIDAMDLDALKWCVEEVWCFNQRNLANNVDDKYWQEMTQRSQRAMEAWGTIYAARLAIKKLNENK